MMMQMNAGIASVKSSNGPEPLLMRFPRMSWLLRFRGMHLHLPAAVVFHVLYIGRFFGKKSNILLKEHKLCSKFAALFKKTFFLDTLWEIWLPLRPF